MTHPALFLNRERAVEPFPDGVRAIRSGDSMGRASLPDLLGEVATNGWNSPAGTEAVAVMQRACRREAARWTWTAGWMTDEGLADTWEQMDR